MFLLVNELLQGYYYCAFFFFPERIAFCTIPTVQ